MQETIEREFEALRDIKRRSSSRGGPGSLRLDPDLPEEPSHAAAPPLSPQAWTEGTAATSPTRASSTGRRKSGSKGDVMNDTANASSNSDEPGAAVDPFHLYWVPAHLHPELAPTEFRAFLKEHAHGPADESGSEDGMPGSPMGLAPGMARSSSQLGRKRSMLSRQYKPRANDGVEEEHVVPSRRKSMFLNEGPQLTINDLQKLEELADEASRSDDPTKLRRMLRRSMSMNVAPSFLDQIDDVNEPQDEADAPIFAPPPNQILRRTARTKIRKPNLSGDGGGHRFANTRRKSGQATRQRGDSTDNVTVTSPTDGSSSGHSGEKEETVPNPITSVPTTTATTLRRPPKVDVEEIDGSRRLTYTEETSIFEAYADDTEDEKANVPPEGTTPPTVLNYVPPLTVTEPEPEAAEPSQPQQPSYQATGPSQVPILHQPQPQRRLSPQQQQVLEVDKQPSRTPSPDSTTTHEIVRPDSRSSVTSEAPSHISTTSATTHHDKRKEKDKKSLWRKVGGGSSSDKHSKKSSKKDEKEREKEREKEKESAGFFNSLFGGKKKQEEAQPSSGLGGGAGPATAAALLGASKSKQPYSPTLSPQLGNPYARYPIHVERAVYRLSHIKLANPRRPLYEQVLISNLMFWYLGIINKANQNQGQQQGAQAQQTAAAQGVQNQAAVQGQENAQSTTTSVSEREQSEQAEREQQERAEREEREKAEKERLEAQQKKESGKRGSLTKAPPAGSGGRRAEVAVKGPQYHIQSQAIEQEYGGGGAPPRSGSAPPPNMNGPQQAYGGQGGYGQRSQPNANSANKKPSSGGQQLPNHSNGYYGRSNSVDMGSGGQTKSSSKSGGLPPGAMPPLSSTDQMWLASQTAFESTQSYTSQTTEWNHHSAQSQPYQKGTGSPAREQGESMDWRPDRDHTSSAKTPMRSLSANAVSNTPPNNHYAQYTQFGQYQQPAGGNDAYGGIQSAVQGQNYSVVKKRPTVGTAPDKEWNRQARVSEDEDVPLAMWQQQQQRRK